MKLPRDVSGAALVKALGKLGCVATRQTGSHARLTASEPSVHHLTVPMHDALRVGTLSAIVSAVAQARSSTREEVAAQLFD